MAAILLLVALSLRLSDLELRPLHHDESINAVKFQELLETGVYVYNPEEYHGPLLYYLTLPVVRLSGADSFADVQAWMLRLGPALLGALCLLLLLALADGIGLSAALLAMLFFAVSPMMVYYNRDYIHETYLVFFTLAAVLSGWRYYLNRHPWWFFLAGMNLAAMQTTKETFVVAWVSMGLAVLCTMAWDGYVPVPRPEPARGKGLPVWVLVGTFALALAVSLLLFSSMFHHPRGMLDSFAALLHYFQRTGGESLHDHPWYYYFAILGYTSNLGAPVWTEALILVLAAAGVAAAVCCRRDARGLALVRFLALYSLIMAAVYSAVSYKTPWLAMNFHVGFILLAGVGAAWLISLVRFKWARAVVVGLCVAGAVHLGWQSMRLNEDYYASTRHPYVYSQTVPDFLDLVQNVAEAAAQAEGTDTLIEVASPDYWPLPWYLRRYTHVGYWHTPPPHVTAPIIITSTAFAKKLESDLRSDYHPEYFGLRPGLPLLVLIRQDLWDALVEARS